MKAVYLAGRIENNPNKNHWRNEVTRKLVDTFKIYNPVLRECGDIKQIVEGDKKDIICSDVVIVYLDDTPSWGTAMEILWAWQLRKDIVAISKNKKINPWLDYHIKYVFPNIDQCVGYVKILGEMK